MIELDQFAVFFQDWKPPSPHLLINVNQKCGNHYTRYLEDWS